MRQRQLQEQPRCGHLPAMQEGIHQLRNVQRAYSQRTSQVRYFDGVFDRLDALPGLR